MLLLYYITDRRALPGTEGQQRVAVLRCIASAASAGIDYIQLREKDLSARELERLAREAVRVVRARSAQTKLLINGRADVALAAGADGVHLPGGELPPSEVRALWRKASPQPVILGVSCHTIAEVRHAEAHGADFCVLAPIFEKVQTGASGIGPGILRAACSPGGTVNHTEACHPGRFPVLALGGITLKNAKQCREAGAAGVAGIRLFQEGNIGETVRRLREV